MTDTAPALRVIFRAERSGAFKGCVTAVFPSLPFDYAGRQMTTYATNEGHGGGSRGWYSDTRPATEAEAAPTLAALRSIYETGPDAVRLDVRQRITRQDREELAAEARASRAALREDPSGAPWSPDARAEAFAL